MKSSLPSICHLFTNSKTLSVHCFLKVLVTGHVPPGIAAEGGRSWFYQHFNTRMVHILQQYSDVIIGLHFGHEHADTFRIFYDHSGIHDYYISYLIFPVDIFLLKIYRKLYFLVKFVVSRKLLLDFHTKHSHYFVFCSL